MSKLIVVTQEGREFSFDDSEARSVMEIIRDNGIDELLAMCGGECSCATCHVFVDPAFAAMLPAMSDDEDILLDISDHRSPHSRLACQIPFTEALDGLQVTIAPKD